MSKRSPKKRRRTLPALGLASVSLSMASGACAVIGEANASTPPQQTHEIFLAEEEISDVSLATFYVFNKERPSPLQLARGGCGGGGGGCGHGGGCHGGGAVAVAMQAALAALMLAALAVATSAALVAARTWADALIWEDVTWAGATVVAVAMDAASSSEDASAALAAAEDVAMAAAATPVGYGRRLVGFTAARLTQRQRRKDSDQR